MIVITLLIIFIIIIGLISIIYYLRNQKACRVPSYRPYLWNGAHVIKKNNCYSYALQNLDDNRDSKMYPGEKSGLKRLKKTSGEYTCMNFKKRILMDIPGSYETDFVSQCPCDYYKIAMVLDRKGDKMDFHFYRQDEDGTWSHKPGSNEATNIDASGEIIYNPHTADRNYKKLKADGYDYDVFCGFFCVPYDPQIAINI